MTAPVACPACGADTAREIYRDPELGLHVAGRWYCKADPTHGP